MVWVEHNQKEVLLQLEEVSLLEQLPNLEESALLQVDSLAPALE